MLRRPRRSRPLVGPIEESLDARLDEYLRARVGSVVEETYAGLPMLKFPEDLRAYEQLLWDMRADTVIEIGTLGGGSALWFRDRLRAQRAYGRTAAEPLVISIDLHASHTAPALREVDSRFEDEIRLVEGDVTDPELPDRVAALVGPDRRAFVVEDSAHTYETTLAALEGFARFVPPGGWFVVEDGVVDVDAVRSPDWPSGVLPAIADWLAGPNGHRFHPATRGRALPGHLPPRRLASASRVGPGRARLTERRGLRRDMRRAGVPASACSHTRRVSSAVRSHDIAAARARPATARRSRLAADETSRPIASASARSSSGLP